MVRCAALFLAITLLAGGPAHADEDRAERVRALEALAVEHFDAGRHEQALALYREAHRAWPLPALSFMEARCLEALGRPEEAAATLERALAESPDDALRERIVARLATLRAALAEGRLVLLVDPSGAEVRVDEVPRGVSPLPPLTLAPGVHRVDVHLDGHEPATVRITIEAAGESTVRVSLDPLPAAPEEPAQPPRSRWYGSTWGWVTLGAGVAAGASSGVLFGLAGGDRDDVRDALRVQPVTTMTRASAVDRLARADREEIAGYVLAGVGVALVATSTVLFILHEDDAPSGALSTLTLVPCALPSGGGLSVEGRF